MAKNKSGKTVKGGRKSVKGGGNLERIQIWNPGKGKSGNKSKINKQIGQDFPNYDIAKCDSNTKIIFAVPVIHKRGSPKTENCTSSYPTLTLL
ncbi:hypothetical protein CDAR_114301 [Caerostris darwini]|uniref:Uncharacterized protein n=1 Tax=Caerostris darwini TaxID=1538125 RepID=A0AAV4MA52_9ARAC|nr:hypothetical protein CDAR_114301 [Caerostris darwini]